LLAGAYPAASVADLEAALILTAQHQRGSGADNQYGYGLVNALAAFNALRDAIGSASNGVTVRNGLVEVAVRTASRPVHLRIPSQDAEPISGRPER
jgi:hypothetical protein